MIEKVLQCEDEKGEKNVLFRLPKHVKQFGTGGNVPEIYIEDYAQGYLSRLAANDCAVCRVAVLVGEFVKSEDRRYVFIRGAIEAENAVEENIPKFSSEIWAEVYAKIKRFFPQYEAVGWFLGGPDFLTAVNDTVLQTHLDWFGGRDRVLYRIDPVEKDAAFFVYEKGELVKWQGYFVYYEKNEEMQDFLVSGKPQSVDAGYTEPVLVRLGQRLGRKTEEPEEESAEAAGAGGLAGDSKASGAGLAAGGAKASGALAAVGAKVSGVLAAVGGAKASGAPAAGGAKASGVPAAGGAKASGVPAAGGSETSRAPAATGGLEKNGKEPQAAGDGRSESEKGKEGLQKEGNGRSGTGIIAAAALLVVVAAALRYSRSRANPVSVPTVGLELTGGTQPLLQETGGTPTTGVTAALSETAKSTPSLFGGDFDKFFHPQDEPPLPTQGISLTEQPESTAATQPPKPTKEPTQAPKPTKEPTQAPKPTKEPTKAAEKEPTKEPTKAAEKEPTKEPTKAAEKEPTKEPTKAAEKEPTKEPTKTPADKDIDAVAGVLYRVKSGDTLAAICRSFYGSVARLEEIKEVNQIPDENKIYAGQELFLPE